MIKVAVLSNSHAGALRKVINEQSVVNDKYSFTFFARPGKQPIKGLTLIDRGLSSNDEEVSQWWKNTAGTNVIEFDKYDVFWLHGIGISLKSFYKILKSNANFYSKQLKVSYYSDLKYAIEKKPEMLKTCQLFNRLPLELLCKNVSKPVIITHRPLWTQSVVLKGKYLDFNKNNIESLIEIKDMILQSTSAVYSKYKATYIPQPEVTIDKVFTKDEYCIIDGVHGNNLYGQLVLEAFIKTVSIMTSKSS